MQSMSGHVQRFNQGFGMLKTLYKTLYKKI